MWDLDVTEAWNRWGAGLSAGRSHGTLKASRIGRSALSGSGQVFRTSTQRGGAGVCPANVCRVVDGKVAGRGVRTFPTDNRPAPPSESVQAGG